MAAPVPITIWHWIGFIAFILFLLGVDLGLLQRTPKAVSPKKALIWCAGWLALAMGFALLLRVWHGPDEALEYVAGYFVEFSLSLDNVVAIALIFSTFAVPSQHQHRVLFWGILGALLMRGLMIGAGTVLIARFHWVLLIFGAFLVYNGIRWAFSKEPTANPEANILLRWARKHFPISKEFHGKRFSIKEHGRRVLTPLALVLLMVELTDLIFAIDSVPAVFAVTRKAFIVFTSNIFAILGLRSLYFAAAGAIRYFRHLKAGLAVVLIFVGAKMLIADWYEIPTGISLLVIGLIIATAIGLSLKPVAKGTHA